MYLISQFSKISGLTAKALRYYDEQNILKPSYRAKDTLYRYYDEECVEQADMELCLPIKKRISDSKLECKHLPAIKAICITHYGSHEMLHFAYKALFEYVNEHKIEIYICPPEKYM